MRLAPTVVLLTACGFNSRPPPRPPEPEPPKEPSGTLIVETVERPDEMECSPHDLVVRIGGAPRDQAVTLSGECVGACTEEAKAEGEAQIAEIEARIEAGEGSDSELDYNFTECIFLGAVLARRETVKDMDVAIIQGEQPGAHDIANTYFVIATKHCDRPWTSQPFGATYVNRWSAEALSLELLGRTLTVYGEGETRQPLYRATFDAGCAAPVEEVLDAEQQYDE